MKTPIHLYILIVLLLFCVIGTLYTDQLLNSRMDKFVDHQLKTNDDMLTLVEGLNQTNVLQTEAIETHTKSIVTITSILAQR